VFLYFFLALKTFIKMNTYAYKYTRLNNRKKSVHPIETDSTDKYPSYPFIFTEEEKIDIKDLPDLLLLNADP